MKTTQKFQQTGSPGGFIPYLLTLWCLIVLMVVMPTARAEFPERPITLVVPYGPGSAIDAVARGLAQGAQKRLGQNIVVDNKSGAGGALGTMTVGRRPADGYTIGIVDRKSTRLNSSH